MLIDKRKNNPGGSEDAKKFNSLPEELQIALRYYNWILFDCTVSKNYETFDETLQFRLWCLETMEAIGIHKNIIPMPPRKDLMRIWFDITSKLDTESLKQMKDTYFSIKKRYNGYTALSDAEEEQRKIESQKRKVDYEKRARQKNIYR